jgi:hypothetical protein
MTFRPSPSFYAIMENMNIRHDLEKIYQEIKELL